MVMISTSRGRADGALAAGPAGTLPAESAGVARGAAWSGPGVELRPQPAPAASSAAAASAATPRRTRRATRGAPQGQDTANDIDIRELSGARSRSQAAGILADLRAPSGPPA